MQNSTPQHKIFLAPSVAMMIWLLLIHSGACYALLLVNLPTSVKILLWSGVFCHGAYIIQCEVLGFHGQSINALITISNSQSWLMTSYPNEWQLVTVINIYRYANFLLIITVQDQESRCFRLVVVRDQLSPPAFKKLYKHCYQLARRMHEEKK